jgi:hypothetical protein
MSGQVGPQMTNALNNFGHDRGLAMFADWSNRIAARARCRQRRRGRRASSATW